MELIIDTKPTTIIVETQLDRIEQQLRELLAALAHVNERLDAVCGKEPRDERLRYFGEVPL